jgi:reductive dehalogenase
MKREGTLSGYQIDESVYKRPSQTKSAFNLLSRKMERPLLDILLGQMFNLYLKTPNTNLDTVPIGEDRALLASTLSANTYNTITGAYGEGVENKQYLKWDPLFIPPELVNRPPEIVDPKNLTSKVKKMAKFLGADLVGIAKLDQRWVYGEVQKNYFDIGEPVTKRILFKRIEKPTETDTEFIIPESFTTAVVMIIRENRLMIQTSPSLGNFIAANQAYSKLGFAAVSLAEFIRAMGFNAIPCVNNTTLSIPLAIDAGLGELGRHGLLITEKYGPCVRICKVLTNMPLNFDKPQEFGVKGFCQVCKKCADHCPSRSISKADMTWEGSSEGNNPGIFKWYIDPESCLEYWTKIGSSCSTCKAVCPYTKGDEPFIHSFVRGTIKHLPLLNKFWLFADDLFGYGEKRAPHIMWE